MIFLLLFFLKFRECGGVPKLDLSPFFLDADLFTSHLRFGGTAWMWMSYPCLNLVPNKFSEKVDPKKLLEEISEGCSCSTV